MTKRITLLCTKRTPLTSLLGPLEILQLANYQQPHFQLSVTGEQPPPVDLPRLGVPFVPMDENPEADVIIIAGLGTLAPEHYPYSAQTTQWLQTSYQQGGHLASICTGAFLLAHTGLLNGLNATTHWLRAPAFEKQFPDVQLDANAMLVKEPRLWSSGGAYAFQDLSLAVIDHYAGAQTAREIAELLLLEPPRRQQNHYANLQRYQQHNDARVKKVQGYIEAHLQQAIRLSDLADVAALSARQLSRRFHAACGITPFEYQQQARVAHAKAQLCEKDVRIADVAGECGFEDIAYFRQLFKKYSGMSPQAYRERVLG